MVEDVCANRMVAISSKLARDIASSMVAEQNAASMAVLNRHMLEASVLRTVHGDHVLSKAVIAIGK